MTPKEKRIIENDLKILFSPKAFQVPRSIEEWQEIGLFHPTITTEKGEFPLSAAGVAALRRVTRIIQGNVALKDLCSEREIEVQVHTAYESWIRKLLQPDADEFLQDVQQTLLSTVKDHIYLVVVEGLELSGVEKIELGLTTISEPDTAILSGLEFGGLLDREWVERDFGKKMWLLGKSHGSPEVSLRRFEHRATLTIGILAVCGSLLYKGAIWRSHVRVMTAPQTQSGAVSVLQWEVGGTNSSLSRSMGDATKLLFDEKAIRYLRG
jgi:hypothetical protein